MNSPEEEAVAALARLNEPNSSVEDKSSQREKKDEADSAGKKLDKSNLQETRSAAEEIAGDGDGANDASKNGKRNKRVKEEFKFPVEPRVVAVVKKPRTYMNHSYRDFSQVPKELNHEEPSEISAMTFSQKVHHILSQVEFKKWISWMPHGRAFRIHVPKLFEQKVSPKYFGHSRYSSFLRQLNNYGFKHITQGKDRNCYYHEFMLRGLPHLSKYMPKPKDARRLIPDPENEPDFYRLSKLYPLPDDPSFGQDGVEVAEDGDAAQAAVASTADLVTSKSRSASEVDWVTTQLPEAKRLRSLSNAEPLVTLSGSANLTTAPQPTLSGTPWPIQGTAVPNLQAALDQNAVLAALAGYGASARNPTLADILRGPVYPASGNSQLTQNLFNAFRHL